jgi:threonine dehydrogenase-like Zn-dependent dehydrogenase
LFQGVGPVSLTLNVNKTDPDGRLAGVREATNGLGVDVVLSCSGVPAGLLEALRVVRVGGVVVEAGTFVDMVPVSVNPNSDICTRNISIIGIGGETASSYLPSMRMMAANLDHLPFHTIVSHRMPLARAQQAVELAQTEQAMKVVIAPLG